MLAVLLQRFKRDALDARELGLRAMSKTHAALTHRGRLVPGFVILGTQRGGTTSLFRLLSGHPRIWPAIKKQIHFFDLQVDRGMPWYASFFPVTPGGNSRDRTAMTGEATPYYLFHPLVPARMAVHLPDAKLIVMVRNPVSRAFSQYQHEVRLGYEDAVPFERAIDLEAKRLAGEEKRIISDPGYKSFAHMHHSYLARGVYADQLARWFQVYPKEGILVLRSEDFFADPPRMYAEVIRFLGLETHELGPAGVHAGPSTASPTVPPMRAETRKSVSDYFRPHNLRLSELLGGRELGWDR